MNLSLGKIIAFAYGSITRRLYLHTAIVAVFLLIVISITIWSGNTLTMITAIARFERTHTVSRVEAMVALLKFLEYKKPGDVETFQAKMAITQSYNKVFSRLLEMRKDTPDAEFARILENTFSETDHKTAVIIVNRIKVLYWHPILKEMVADAAKANAAGEKIKAQAAQILAANNVVERTALFADIEKTENELIFYETSFSKRCSDLSNEISTYDNYISVVLLFFSAGFTGLMTYMIAKTLLKQAATYTSDLENEIQVRKQVEEALRKNEYHYRTLFENALVGVTVVGSDGMIIEANDAFCNMLEYAKEEVVGKIGFADVTYPEDKDKSLGMVQSLSRNEIDHYSLEKQYLSKSGKIIPALIYVRGIYNVDGKYEGCTATILDITERKRSEEEKQTLEHQFQHTQKLESLGILAGGIAHDFNNILAIIVGNCGLAKMDSDNAESYIPEIEKAAERAAALCRQMLAYAGKAQLTKTQVNMGIIIDEMVTMLKSTIPQNAEIKPDLSVNTPFVIGDASQLRQIVMNLIINASEAIGKEHGEIQVLLSKAMVIVGQSDKDYHGKTIHPGEYVCLEVTDNGCGMDEETRWRIFEPFYTTKFTGRGLGMSAVLGIIMSHGGALQLFSELRRGTTFKVYLPVPVTESTESESTIQAAPPAPWLGSGTILLAEDEDQVRFIAKSLLKKFGFTVLEAVNGKEALDLYRENAADIILVLTDMGMPVMDGYELFYELKNLNSNLPIIISSGFGDAEVSSRIGSDNIAGLISKPYNLDQLRETLKSVVESPQSPNT